MKFKLVFRRAHSSGLFITLQKDSSTRKMTFYECKIFGGKKPGNFLPAHPRSRLLATPPPTALFSQQFLYEQFLMNEIFSTRIVFSVESLLLGFILLTGTINFTRKMVFYEWEKARQFPSCLRAFEPPHTPPPTALFSQQFLYEQVLMNELFSTRIVFSVESLLLGFILHTKTINFTRKMVFYEYKYSIFSSIEDLHCYLTAFWTELGGDRAVTRWKSSSTCR